MPTLGVERVFISSKGMTKVEKGTLGGCEGKEGRRSLGPGDFPTPFLEVLQEMARLRVAGWTMFLGRLDPGPVQPPARLPEPSLGLEAGAAGPRGL